jgi:hypothetical protein
MTRESVYSGQYSYGYPLPFLYVDKSITLSKNSMLIDCMGVDLGAVIVNIIVLVLIINVFIFLYRIIFFRKRQGAHNKLKTKKYKPFDED